MSALIVRGFHLTKSERYYAAVDRIRVPYSPDTAGRYAYGYTVKEGEARADGSFAHGKQRAIAAGEDTGPSSTNPLGALPPSVWSIATEPLTVPDHVGVDHFAAFPSELPRRLILGWSPAGICTACGEGREPVVEKTLDLDHIQASTVGRRDLAEPDGNGRGMNGTTANGRTRATITGESCVCPAPTAPSRPAVVLDPFSGTGTVCAVARALGRHGIGVDLSADYNRLARWRVFESGTASKARTRTNREAQGVML